MAKLSNPLAFTPLPVSILTTIVYAALFVGLIVVHVTVPPAPNSPPHGINITEAWRDLQRLTRSYHPYNTRSNGLVRDFLLERIEDLISQNGKNTSIESEKQKSKAPHARAAANDAGVFVFNDEVSNLTFSSDSKYLRAGTSVYFEGTNILVYIRGLEDDPTQWWREKDGKPSGKGGVLVNAHYDSVSAGYGATDDGVGVVTILQLIKYYTTEGNTPRKGIVALLNNGEEDYLNGARAYSQHPISKFPHTFLNLEGAAAGGRASLFRTSDTEVTRAYKGSPYPFGSVISADGLEAGLVRSQTDYVVFNGILGLRGLDVAFIDNRARYHTDQDDTRHTSKASLWHMLSAAIETTKALTGDTGDEFEGERGEGLVNSGNGSQGVWFDLFGRAFAVLQAHTMFALSITLLVVSPIALLLTLFVLYKADKFYIFTGGRLYHHPDGDEEVPLFGWRGFFRYPFILVASSAVPVAFAYLLTKYNALIVSSSEWAVWSMMFSSWIFVAWFISRTADFARPTALTRFYAYFWIVIIAWALLVVNVVFEKHMRLGGGYFALFYFASAFVSAWISYLELFALSRKSKYCHEKMESSRRDSVSASQALSPEASEHGPKDATLQDGDEEPEEATESTSLLGRNGRTTFANYSRTDNESAISEDQENEIVGKAGKWFGDEQDWSSSLPRWTWIFQLLLSVPINVIILGQLGFLIVEGLHQTGSDGTSTFIIYLFMSIITILLFIPLLPFIHRFTWHVPIFLLLVLIGTLAYNLSAFPFSTQNRLKVYFQQYIDLETGNHTTSLTGLPPYIHTIVDSLPSAVSGPVDCKPAYADLAIKDNRLNCQWSGLPPNVLNEKAPVLRLPRHYSTWLSYNATLTSPNTARFHFSGRQTRACRLEFSHPIYDVHVHGSSHSDDRFPKVSAGGSKELRLWSRMWEKAWTVDVRWSDAVEGMEGNVVCLWNDGNGKAVPALDEVRHFAPGWVAVSHLQGGLVEGRKSFTL